MVEGHIEGGTPRRKEKVEVSEVDDQRLEQSGLERGEDGLEHGEVDLKHPERWVSDAIDEIKSSETRESHEVRDPEDVQEWVERAVRELVEGEDGTDDAQERAERWTQEIVKDILADERVESSVTDDSIEGDVDRRPWEMRSQGDLDAALERYPDVRAGRDFDKLHEEAVEYYGLEDRDGVDVPDLVQEVEHREIRRAYEAVHDGAPEVSIESMKDVDDLLEKHSTESGRADVDERHEFSELHLKIKDDHSMKRDEIAEKYGVSKGFVTNAWNDIEPAQIRQLRRLEEDRIMKEWVESSPEIDEKVLRESHDTGSLERPEVREVVHHVESQVVKDALDPLKDTKKVTPEDMVSAIEHMVQAAPDDKYRFHCADLQPELGAKHLKQLERHLSSNRDKIEGGLSKSLGLEDVRARVALVEGKMYTWIPKHRPDELVKAYESQFYYFKDNKEVIRVIDDLRKELGVEGTLRNEMKHMTDVVKQFMEGDDGAPSRKKPLDNYSTRLEGKVLRMYLDTTGRKLSDMEGRVVKVAGICGRAGIENPCFPEGAELEVLKARLAAIIASDCHLYPTGRISYNEAHLSRIARVQDIVSEFGDIVLEPKWRRGMYEMHIHCQVGVIMIEEGMTPGNKTINNPELPRGFMDWSERAKRAYLEELIPEDGCFSRQRFSWYRSHAIYVDKQKENYDFDSEIGSAEIELVKKKGRTETGLIPKSYLSIRELEDLQDSDDSAISQAAKNIFEVVFDSTNNLIDDETRLAKSLGLGISLYPQSVSYYPRTGRVSVSWEAVTSTQDDTVHWAEICPPNDVRKRSAVRDWQKSIAERWIDKNPWKKW